MSLERKGDGWLLGVHIADVSHYVTAGSALDREAMKRGTSVYFADRVIPMLPEALSNGLCSLGAGEDKLTLSALLTLDEQGVCRDVRLTKAIIRSKVRGVYSEINDLFQNTATKEIQEKYHPVQSSLDAMRLIAGRMREAGEQRGTVDLISTEAQFTLDGEGHPLLIQPRLTGEAEGMIEQFMIAANVAVAALARRKKAAVCLSRACAAGSGKIEDSGGSGPVTGNENCAAGGNFENTVAFLDGRSPGNPLCPSGFRPTAPLYGKGGVQSQSLWGIMDWRWRTIAILPRLYGAIPTWPYIGFCPMCWHTPPSRLV